jgi:autotransporter strand-loop-strand O-heptosyltransferase
VQANYEEVRSWYLAKAEEYDWNRVCAALVEKYEAVLEPADPSRRPSMAEQAESLYRRTKRLGIEYFPARNRVFCTFIDGPKVEIIGGLESTYHVEFVDAPTGRVVHAGDIRNNMWIMASRKYYTDWLIRITDVPANETIEYRFDLKNRRAHVIFDTTALGDTIAWVPYVDEFARKHSCRVTCACAHRDLFASEYPGVDFVDINAAPAPDTYARYVINWQPNDRERNPVDVRTVPLQRVASNALGLEFREIRPRIK